ncbi:bifunctional [glutamine synthetase] adenylyltransferase/[glutamine synthetase]-adenylyl-L-tyrosine phosphorylase [Demequina globuliformis]|uniref:bifunctional [glutamine synthetase] adenylyltransferase/[glutamine synthetase]-adenylyl-L-tyrosine phosphorylase n=1 Tax=Demequina globuliformis TaxID=676202 RepID=UPI0007859660|nr:bifunctional [glutamine synthetase] adenylyltransferase/[glutamine synthetase]-adenylyl-L-tyrosine phosphorylase [Demequina globuliformis]
MSTREVSLATKLRRAGVADPSRAAGLIAQLESLAGESFDDPARALSYLADPDAGLLQLLRVAEAAQESGHLADLLALRGSAAGAKFGLLLGGSLALGDFLVRHPEFIADFASWPEDESFADVDVRAAILRAVGADPDDDAPVASVTGPDGVAAMRVEYRRQLMRVAAEDLWHAKPQDIFPEVGRALADLAGAALEAGLALARAGEPKHVKTRVAIMGMGKCGARELNYVSDVDVIFVAEPAEGASDAESLAVATRLAAAAARACDRAGAEMPLWQVDANLRPEGKDGALVRNVASHRAYYDRWAESWEFQALLKARTIAGDREVGAAYLDAVWPMVWTAVERDGFVTGAQAMRKRVEEHVPADVADRQIKLGAGGLRDVEFTIQLLQLVHGRHDESLRSRTTLDALRALRDGGYVGRPDAAKMDRSYRQLRVWEHRLQLRKLHRTHVMPMDDDGKRVLARASGFATVEYMDEVWQDIRRDVRALHLEMFYRPILPLVASLSADEARLDDEAARDRLAAVGFRDATAAQRHIAALTEGVSRRAAIQRQLLPAMIGWFASGADPDAGLLAFRTLSEHLSDTQWYLKLLRDSGSAAERLARLLSTSPYVTDALLASAEHITWLDNDADLAPRSLERLEQEADAILKRTDDADHAITALRGLRRRELARVAAADTLGLINSTEAAASVTDCADVVLAGALRIARWEVARAAGLDELPFRMIVVAMGRYGGAEMSYTSDADVQFVWDGTAEGSQSLAVKVAQAVRTMLQKVSSQPSLAVDADLRPEGRNGPYARSLNSSAEYYGRWSDPWEAQALLRARPCAGDGELREAFTAMIDEVRYPESLPDTALRQMRTLKARMESERLPRGLDPRRHLKLGPGGLSDVEWTIQLVQMQHGRTVETLRTTRTLPALQAAVAAELMSVEDAETLSDAWTLTTDLRGALALRGKAKEADVLPGDPHELAILTEIMATPETGMELRDRYERTTRHARAVMERLFYGWEDTE